MSATGIHPEIAAVLSGERRWTFLAPGAVKPPLGVEWDIHCDRCGEQLRQGWAGEAHHGCGGTFLIFGTAEAKP